MPLEALSNIVKTKSNDIPMPVGRVRAYNCPIAHGASHPTTEWLSNLVVYEWASIAANLLVGTGLNYRIGGMYFEFENVAAPGDTVTPPAFDRTRDVDYYNALSGSSNRDYLRVAIGTSKDVTSADTTLFPHGNVCTLFTRTVGTTGVHGKTFSDSVNSVIFGAALVAYVDATDATQDLIFSSAYLSAADQQAKLSTSQVGLEWVLELQ